jgi:hypothetical protein
MGVVSVQPEGLASGEQGDEHEGGIMIQHDTQRGQSEIRSLVTYGSQDIRDRVSIHVFDLKFGFQKLWISEDLP